MSVKIKSKDMGKARKEYIAQMKKLAADNALHVAIGVMGENSSRDKKKGEALSNVDIASIHEFGAVIKKTNTVIPERSFIRSTFKTHKKKYKALIYKSALALASNRIRQMNKRRMLGLIGARVAADIKRTITKGIELRIHHVGSNN